MKTKKMTIMTIDKEYLRDLVLRRIPEGTRFVLEDLVDCMADAYSAGWLEAGQKSGEFPRPWVISSRLVGKHSAVCVVEDAEGRELFEIGDYHMDDALARRVIAVINSL